LNPNVKLGENESLCMSTREFYRSKGEFSREFEIAANQDLRVLMLPSLINSERSLTDSEDPSLLRSAILYPPWMPLLSRFSWFWIDQSETDDVQCWSRPLYIPRGPDHHRIGSPPSIRTLKVRRRWHRRPIALELGQHSRFRTLAHSHSRTLRRIYRGGELFERRRKPVQISANE